MTTQDKIKREQNVQLLTYIWGQMESSTGILKMMGVAPRVLKWTAFPSSA